MADTKFVLYIRKIGREPTLKTVKVNHMAIGLRVDPRGTEKTVACVT